MKDFIDNQNGNTLGESLREQLASHRKFGKAVPYFCLATAYFNPQGFLLLANELAQVPRVQLLLGAEPKPEALQAKRSPRDPPEPEFTKREVRAAITQLERGLARDRDLINFGPEASKSIRETIRLLRSSNIEVRRFESGFLHAKAYLFREVPIPGLIAGSSNLTCAGLTWNRELNLGVYGCETVERGKVWFDGLWEESVPYDLAALYEAVTHLYSPFLIYMKVLDAIYGSEVAEEDRDPSKIPLAEFQRHGVWRALRIIDKYRGVIIADGVGLGKTFTAGEIIDSYRNRRQRVLLVCPASLRDSTWKEFLNRFQLLVECVSYEQLADDRRLYGTRDNLKSETDEYALVIVDEAHNYRNPDAKTRARVLNKFLYGKPKDLVLLTATPVNNSLWDLYQLLRFFLKQDAQLVDRGIISLRQTFTRAMREDPFSLSPDVLFPIIDAVTVKRTRNFVRKYYENDKIKDDKGNLVPILFPKPIAISLHYNLELAQPGIFTRIENAIAPPDGCPALLKLARYQPQTYRIGGPREDERGGQALIGLIRSGLLKRFESSAVAFVKTAEKMASQHDDFLKALALGKVPTTQFLHELAGDEDDAGFEALFDEIELEAATGYDIPRLRRDILSDRDLLRKLAQEVSKVGGTRDPKFDVVCDALAAIAEEARKEGLDEDDKRQKRKVLVFSYFEDTVDAIEEKLLLAVRTDKRLAVFRERIASASGTEYRGGISRKDAVEGFAPTSMRAPANTKDRFDILIATDVLAEGQNLQQARHIINYDLPWNPMRLVQRHGRIDRIGSPHPKVFLRTIFPDNRLDDLLKLEDRVRRKLAQAAASVGVEISPILVGKTGEQVFAENREEVEKLYHENPEIYERGGTATAAQTGEEYRQILRAARRDRAEDIDRLPWKVGSAIRRGDTPGWFFCAKVAERIYLRFVHANKEGAPSELENLKVETELGFCLRQIECAEDIFADESAFNLDSVYAAWEKAKASIQAMWDFESDPFNLQPRIRSLNKSVAKLLRAAPPNSLEQNKRSRALDILESPWPRREENQLREWLTAGEPPAVLVEQILAIGIEPFTAPNPLPPISPDDIHLVVWLAIASANTI